ncbi:MAG: hydrogenase maturation nickel metallochaperone HypA [Nanoarchaeota archaeon]|nr:hydrogenase maturation nickel metallochaperone HypA [Nanoarchaeota archaeon]
MHEQTIAAKIIEDAKSYGNVKSLTIEVGDLAHLPAQEMKEVMEKLTDWKINIIKKNAIIACKCGYTGEPKIIQQLHDNNIYECPECNESLPQILEGQHIILKEVEVEEETESKNQTENDNSNEDEDEEYYDDFDSINNENDSKTK